MDVVDAVDMLRALLSKRASAILGIAIAGVLLTPAGQRFVTAVAIKRAEATAGSIQQRLCETGGPTFVALCPVPKVLRLAPSRNPDSLADQQIDASVVFESDDRRAKMGEGKGR